MSRLKEGYKSDVLFANTAQCFSHLPKASDCVCVDAGGSHDTLHGSLSASAFFSPPSSEGNIVEIKNSLAPLL